MDPSPSGMDDAVMRKARWITPLLCLSSCQSSGANHELAELRQQVVELRSDLLASQQQVRAVKAEIHASQARAEALQSEVTTLEDLRTELRGELRPLVRDAKKDLAPELQRAAEELAKGRQIPVSVAGGDTRFTIVSAKIGKVPIQDFGDKVSVDDFLIVELRIKNLHARRILTFRPGGSWGSIPRLILHDDYGNRIDRVNPGLGATIVGDASGSTIYPDKAITHRAVFHVPPKATRHLELKVNLECVGAKGETQAMIFHREDWGWRPLQ